MSEGTKIKTCKIPNTQTKGNEQDKNVDGNASLGKREAKLTRGKTGKQSSRIQNYR